MDACSLVDHRTWSVTDLAALAQHFCWRRCEGIRQDLVAVAPFAKMVYMRLRNT